MMMLAWLLAICAVIPLLVFSVECLLGLGSTPRGDAPATAPPFAVLIPAHDEIVGIAAVVAAVSQQLRDCDRLLVVADNCSDGTAEVARRAGATVTCRTDTARAGKAFALDHGRMTLRADPPEVVIVLDADCVPEPGALARLAAESWARQAAVQGRNLLECAADAPPIVRISSFAFMVKNLIRQRGLQRLSGLSLLQGTGMALPWRFFDTAPLATSSLVEDMRLGLDLALSGHVVRFAEAAGVSSAAASQGATRAQRTRWEHGAMTTAAEYVPHLLTAGLRGRPRLLLLAADLLIPPLALLVSATATICAALLLVAVLGGSAAPLALVMACASLFALALALIWRERGRALLPLSTLMRLPLYILWKQPIYRGLISGVERRWVRTSRVP